MLHSASPATLNAILRAFKRLGTQGDYKAFRAYIASEDYHQLMSKLDAGGYLVATNALVAAQQACVPLPPLAKKWSMRVKWTPEMIAKLKAADQKYGTDEGIARALGIPFHNARRARRRFLGLRHPVVVATAA